jgi:O-antigen ligase
MIENIKQYILKSRNNIDLLLLGLLVLSLPFERIPSLDVFSVTIRASLAFGVMVIVRSLYLLITKKAHIKKSIPHFLLLAFVAWIILIIPESINLKRAVQVVGYDVFVILLAVSVAVIYRKDYLKYLISLLFGVTVVVSAFAFYQFFGDIIGVPNTYTGLAERYTSGLFGFPRVQGFSLEPLYFGSFMLIPTMLLFTFTALKQHEVTSSKSTKILLFVFSTVIFITVARGAFYGFIAGIFVVVLVALIKRLASAKALIVAIAIVIFAFIASLLIVNYGSKIPLDVTKTLGKTGGSAFTQQLLTTGLEGSGDERAVARRQAIQLLQENKFAIAVGIGPGQFGPYITNNVASNSGWTIVNNLTLELLLELGFIGLGLVVVFLAWITIDGLGTLKNNKINIQSASCLGLIAYLATQAVQYQGFSTLYVIHIWVAIGLLMGIIRVSQENSSSQSTKSKNKIV